MPEKIIQKECKHHGLTEFILEGRGSYRCKTCRIAGVMRHRRKLKDKLAQHFGGKCELCGYNRCLQGLQFHHFDPKTKEFGISEAGVTRSWEKCLAEAMKCVLMCGNCHTEVENGVTEIPKEITQRFL